MHPLLAHGTVLDFFFVPPLVWLVIALALIVIVLASAAGFAFVFLFVDVLFAMGILLIWNRRRHLFWVLPVVNVAISAVASAMLGAMILPQLEEPGWKLFWLGVMPALSLGWAIVCGLILATVHSPIKFGENELKTRAA